MQRNIVLMLLFIILSAASVLAAETYVMFEGTVVEEMPCSINDDEPIDLDFGDAVAISRIDGVNFARPLTLEFTCSSEPTKSLTVTIKATATGFDNSAVQTDIGDLGIRLTKSGNGIAFNTPMLVSYPAPLALMGTPVKRPGATLSPGEFVAISTAVVDYF